MHGPHSSLSYMERANQIRVSRSTTNLLHVLNIEDHEALFKKIVLALDHKT